MRTIWGSEAVCGPFPLCELLISCTVGKVLPLNKQIWFHLGLLLSWWCQRAKKSTISSLWKGSQVCSISRNVFLLSRFAGSKWVRGVGLHLILKIQVLGKSGKKTNFVLVSPASSCRTPFLPDTSPASHGFNFYSTYLFTSGSLRATATCLVMSPY